MHARAALLSLSFLCSPGGAAGNRMADDAALMAWVNATLDSVRR